MHMLVDFGNGVSSMLKFTVLFCDCPTIIGMPFLQALNPDIDWVNKTVKFKNECANVTLGDENQFASLPVDETTDKDTNPVITTCATRADPVKPVHK